MMKISAAKEKKKQYAGDEEDEMSISDVSNVFGFLGGLGMFLYGMNIMADGMQKTAGSKMSSFLGMLTNNRLLAVALGALITAIIQSSGATTVMVVGFVSAGVLNLTQAVGVIMGANIGTTITAWIVSMSQLGDAFEVMKPSFYAPAIIGIGALLLVFAKGQKKKTAGEICIGLGLLFIGLDFMSGSISPYTDAPIFAKAFEVLGGNPFLGMIIICISGNSADSGNEWNCNYECSNLYYPGTEYWFLRNSHAFQYRRFPDRQEGCGNSSDL